MTFDPRAERPSWTSLTSHSTDVKSLSSARTVRPGPPRGERFHLEAEGIYFDYSKKLITEETLGLLLELAHESDVARAPRRHVRGRAHQRLGGSRRPARRAANAAGTRPWWWTASTSSPRCTHVLDRMADFAQRFASGEWRGHTGKPIRNMVNIGIGGSDLGPVMAYEALRHYSRRDLTFRFVSNVDATDFVEARARPRGRRDALHHLLQDLRHAGDADERRVGANVAASIASATRRPSPSTSWPSRPTPRRSRPSASTWPTCSSSGTGSGPLLDGERHRTVHHDRHRPRRLRRDARRVSRDGRALSHGALRREPAGAPRTARRVESRFPRLSDRRRHALRPVPAPTAGLPATAHHGVQRQARHPQRRARDLRDRAYLLGRARHQRPAQLLSTHPPRHDQGARRLHRIRHEPQSARRTPRHLDVQCLRPGRGAGLWQDRSRVARRGRRRARLPHRVMEGNRPSNVLLAEELTPRLLGSLIALYEHSVFVQGTIWKHRLLRPVGRRARQAASCQDHSRVVERCPGELPHDSSTNALITRYRSLKENGQHT